MVGQITGEAGPQGGPGSGQGEEASPEDRSHTDQG